MYVNYILIYIYNTYNFFINFYIIINKILILIINTYFYLI